MMYDEMVLQARVADMNRTANEYARAAAAKGRVAKAARWVTVRLVGPGDQYVSLPATTAAPRKAA